MTKLLDEYLKKIEQKKEEKRQKLLQRTQRALKQLYKELHFKKAYIFGSILKKKRFYYDSDVDIAVFGLKDKDFFYFMSRAADILGRNIDVVQLEKHLFKNKIIKEGLLWKKES